MADQEYEFRPSLPTRSPVTAIYIYVAHPEQTCSSMELPDEVATSDDIEVLEYAGIPVELLPEAVREVLENR